MEQNLRKKSAVVGICVGAVLGYAVLLADQSVTSKHTRVIDGDTMIVSGKIVRLSGIDAFEIYQTCTSNGNEYNCGREARDKLSGLVSNGVKCSPQGTDKYGRTLAVCHSLLDGTDINAEMVRSGLAMAYRHYSTDYVPLEAEAMIHRRGGWSGMFQQPYDWRKSHPSR